MVHPPMSLDSALEEERREVLALLENSPTQIRSTSMSPRTVPAPSPSGSIVRDLAHDTPRGPFARVASTLPPQRSMAKKTPRRVIGICALDSKARSKSSRRILNRLNNDFDVVVFGDKVILDEDITNWPQCDYLMSYYSDGFPLDKAIAYVKERQPFCVNDVALQLILFDRRLSLRLLDGIGIPTPRRIEINRDGGPQALIQLLIEYLGEASEICTALTTSDTPSQPSKIELLDNGDVLRVDDKLFKKPFVEKPVSSEDHNIVIYYPSSMGGGARRLFRKIGNRSSEYVEHLTVPRIITEPQRSFVVEEFLRVENAEDVKVFTVGSEYCLGETRKSPVVDGVVRRNTHGKEIRYITALSREEKETAAKITKAFGQRICGFDILRSNGKSYVMDVNGWAFANDNDEYYENCAAILRKTFLQVQLGLLRGRALSQQPLTNETDTREHRDYSTSTKDFPIDEQRREDGPHPTEQAQKWKLKGVVSVIRNADHTPKQASTFTFDSKPFSDLLQKDKTQSSLRSSCTISSSAVLDAIGLTRHETQEPLPEVAALEELLTKKAWAKVHIKPVIDDRTTTIETAVHSDHLAVSSESMTSAYQSAHTPSTRQIPLAEQYQRVQLTVKYGAEPTHAARYQSQELGRDMRSDIILLNRDILNHVRVRCSSTMRATATAQIWTTSFLEQKDVPEGVITTREDLLDFAHTTKRRKEEIRTTLAQSRYNGEVSENIDSPHEKLGQLRSRLGRLKTVFDRNWKRLGSAPTDSLNIQARWCCGEDPLEFRDRWMGLCQQIGDEDNFDVMKVLQLYSYLRFDALHNRQFLEWIFAVSPGPVVPLWTATESDLKKPESIAERIEKGDMEKAASQIFHRHSNPDQTWSTPRDHLTGPTNQSYLSELYQLSRDLSKYLRQRVYMSHAPEESDGSLPTCLPLLKTIINDLEEIQTSHMAQAVVYFAREGTLYMLLNSIFDSGIETTIDKDSIPELDFLSHISLELFEAISSDQDDPVSSSSYRIRITISPGCYAADVLEVRLDSKHCIGCSPRQSLTPYVDWRSAMDSLISRVHSLDASLEAGSGKEAELAAEENKNSRDEAGTRRNISSGALSETKSDDITDGASDASSSGPSRGFWSENTKPTENSSLPSHSGLENSNATSSRSLTTFYNYTALVPEAPDDEDTDIQSVTSLKDDIHSLAESTSAGEERRAAAAYIVHKLTDDPELLSLYQDAIRSISETRFIRNNKRLLKRYFLDLQAEGQTASQKLAIGFLRSRVERTRISAQIFYLMVPSDGLIREKINIILGENKDELLLLNRLLSDKDSGAQPYPVNEPADAPADFKAQQEGDVYDVYDYEDSDDDSFEWNDDDVRDSKEENGLPELESAAQFLTSSRAFALYKDNFRNFLGSTTRDTQESHNAEVSTFLGEERRSLDSPCKDTTGQTWSPGNRQRGFFGLYRTFVLWMTRQMRPVLKEGYRRIEWRCDCGDTLYADFTDEDNEAFERLAQSLQIKPSRLAVPSNATESKVDDGGQQSARDKSSGQAQQNQDPTEPNRDSKPTAGRLQDSDQLTQDQKQEGSKFLALCVNTGGIYKTLVEINTADTESDAAVFLKMKQAYKNTRGLRYRFRLIIKPVAVEFVQFTLWNLRSGYVSVCDRPNCIPPETAKEYDYMPKPLRPPPPMPPEVFIHYLEHGEGELNPGRNTWLPRLPKRRDARVIDGDVACYGWGIHIIEGPNREVVFWIIMATLVASVVAAVAWTALRDDIQGGAGLGALMMALPPIIMAAFLFRLGS